MNNSQLKVHKVIVVTGAGSGIGRAVARAFLEAGHLTVLAGRRESELHESAGNHPNALVVPCDVTVVADVERLFASAVERFSRVDVLFNNAGIFGPSASVDQLDPAQWQ